MAKVVFFGFPAFGHIAPTIGLVKELILRGEEVFYYCTQEYQPKIEGMGANFRDYHILLDKNSSSWDKFMEENAEKRIDDMKELYDIWLKKLSLTMAIIQNPEFDIQQEIGAIEPDYIIHDSAALWGKIIARNFNVPAVSSITTFAYCDELFEIAPALIIKDGLWLSDKFLNNIPATRRMIELLSRKIGKTLSIEDSNYLYFSKEGLNLVYTSLEFQIFGEVFDSQFKFVGSSVTQRNDEVDFPMELLGENKIIYISLGSICSSFDHFINFYRKCFEALGKTDSQVVLVTGRIERAALGEIPENFLVKSFVPQIEILQRADLFITHGGMNSVNESLYFHVPMIIIPQFSDQHLNAKRVVELGAGISFENMEFTSSELAVAIHNILSDESFRRNAERIGESLKAAGGSKRAADEIFLYKERHGITKERDRFCALPY
ncbi:MAG TPA: macrolide family glycosyltransferase [Bacillota bacterium]|nr:macrolide family glycosyltransferase [Bacillota bacterium]